MEFKILNCPFCGSDGRLNKQYSWYVKCTNDECGCVLEDCPMDEDGAIQAWNTRQPTGIEATPLDTAFPSLAKSFQEGMNLGGTPKERLVEISEEQLRVVIIENSSGKGFDIPVNYEVKVNILNLAKAIYSKFGHRPVTQEEIRAVMPANTVSGQEIAQNIADYLNGAK